MKNEKEVFEEYKASAEAGIIRVQKLDSMVNELKELICSYPNVKTNGQKKQVKDIEKAFYIISDLRNILR